MFQLLNCEIKHEGITAVFRRRINGDGCYIICASSLPSKNIYLFINASQMRQVFNFLEYIKCEEDHDLPFGTRMLDGEYCKYLKPVIGDVRVSANHFSKP